LKELFVAILFAISAGSLVACTDEPVGQQGQATQSLEPSASTPSPAAERSCPPVVESTVTGRVVDPSLDEISGLVVGRRMAGVLWVEEDSGNEAAVYALKPTGEVVADVRVDGATNEDWEDLAWAKGRLWIGDIGDNERDRSMLQVYSFREPDDRGVTRVHATVTRLRYEDGPHDAEAMFVDPRDERLYIIVKELSRARTAVYAVPLREVRSGNVGVLRVVTHIPFSSVTAADLGPAGIAVRNYLTAAVFPWSDDRTVVSTLDGKSCPVSLESSEAIAQTPDGAGLYSIREGSDASVRYVDY
jgi:hypothetical protein